MVHRKADKGKDCLPVFAFGFGATVAADLFGGIAEL